MLGLLPWERLPGWLLGPFMAALGILLALNEQPYSWKQVGELAFAIWGVGVFIHWIQKMRSSGEPEAGDAN